MENQQEIAEYRRIADSVRQMLELLVRAGEISDDDAK